MSDIIFYPIEPNYTYQNFISELEGKMFDITQIPKHMIEEPTFNSKDSYHAKQIEFEIRWYEETKNVSYIYK